MASLVPFVLGIAATIATALLVAEIKGWLSPVGCWIVRLAARRLPAPHSERYREEWLAELDAVEDRPLTTLLYATRVLVRCRALRTELGDAAPGPERTTEPFTRRVRTLRYELTGGPYCVTAARLALADLDDLLEEQLVFDVRLLVSELIVNAVRHAGVGADGFVLLQVDVATDKVRVAVADGGPGFIPPSDQITGEAASDSGWGLFFVSQLADRWGVEAGGQVWFEMLRYEADGGDPAPG